MSSGEANRGIEVKQSGATNIDPAGSIQTSRRSFVKLAAAVLLTAGGRPCEALTQAPPARTSPLADLPTLDGQLLFDDAARQACAVDNGGHVHHSPIAVLKPHSADDVVRLVAYANKRGLKIAMRGQGHSQYGQSQAAGGVVIDSSTLNSVRWHGSDTVDAQPGALWGDVAKVTLAKLLTPPVMPDAMMLTVGGTLSVGGIGETTYRYGAQVDNVLELDVITGAGELVTCSPDGNDELFNMTLAGVGQCGIIVPARLRLVAAPRFIAIHPLLYDDMESFSPIRSISRPSMRSGRSMAGSPGSRPGGGSSRCSPDARSQQRRKEATAPRGCQDCVSSPRHRRRRQPTGITSIAEPRGSSRRARRSLRAPRS
jgi:hypothetical protein